MTFRKPKVRNSWAHIEVTDRHGFAMRSGSYLVRWPDGTEEKLWITLRHESHSYSEQGQLHSTTVSSSVPYIRCRHHGELIELRIPDLHGVEIWEDE